MAGDCKQGAANCCENSSENSNAYRSSEFSGQRVDDGPVGVASPGDAGDAWCLSNGKDSNSNRIADSVPVNSGPLRWELEYPTQSSQTHVSEIDTTLCQTTQPNNENSVTKPVHGPGLLVSSTQINIVRSCKMETASTSSQQAQHQTVETGKTETGVVHPRLAGSPTRLAISSRLQCGTTNQERESPVTNQERAMPANEALEEEVEPAQQHANFILNQSEENLQSLSERSDQQRNCYESGMRKGLSVNDLKNDETCYSNNPCCRKPSARSRFLRNLGFHKRRCQKQSSTSSPPCHLSLGERASAANPCDPQSHADNGDRHSCCRTTAAKQPQGAAENSTEVERCNHHNLNHHGDDFEDTNDPCPDPRVDSSRGRIRAIRKTLSNIFNLRPTGHHHVHREGEDGVSSSRDKRFSPANSSSDRATGGGFFFRPNKRQKNSRATVQRALPPVPSAGDRRLAVPESPSTGGHTSGCSASPSNSTHRDSLEVGGGDFVDTSPSLPFRETAEEESQGDFAASIEKVKDQGWYWGPLSGEVAEKILATEPDGSFVVRDSSDHHYIFSLTFKLNGFIRHVRIEHDQGNFSFGSFTKFKSNTIVDFIENAVEHSRSGRYLFFLHRRPVLGPIRVQLLHPVSRFKRVQSLQHLCRYVIVTHVRKDLLHELPVPKRIKNYLNTPFYYSEQIEAEAVNDPSMHPLDGSEMGDNLWLMPDQSSQDEVDEPGPSPGADQNDARSESTDGSGSASGDAVADHVPRRSSVEGLEEEHQHQGTTDKEENDRSSPSSSPETSDNKCQPDASVEGEEGPNDGDQGEADSKLTDNCDPSKTGDPSWR